MSSEGCRCSRAMDDGHAAAVSQAEIAALKVTALALSPLQWMPSLSNIGIRLVRTLERPCFDGKGSSTEVAALVCSEQ